MSSACGAAGFGLSQEAQKLGADQVIIEKIRGRRGANRWHVPFTGTLGVLAAGAEQGLLDLRKAVERLRKTSFHISQEILDRLIKERQLEPQRRR